MAQQQVKTIEKAQSKNNHLNIQYILKQQIHPIPSLVLLTDHENLFCLQVKFHINLLVKAEIQILFLDICAVCIQAHRKTKTSSNPQCPLQTGGLIYIQPKTCSEEGQDKRAPRAFLCKI